MENIIPFQTEMKFPAIRELATDTRDEAYITLDEGGRETWHRKMISVYLKYGGLCDHDMEIKIGLRIHLVSARRNDLTMQKYIEKYGYMAVKAKDEQDKPIRMQYKILVNGKWKNSSGQVWKLVKIDLNFLY